MFINLIEIRDKASRVREEIQNIEKGDKRENFSLRCSEKTTVSELLIFEHTCLGE